MFHERNTSKPRLQREVNGFTLVEVIVVVVVLAIAGAIVVPMVSNASRLQARAAADMVHSDIDYTRSLAMAHGQVYRVAFDTGSESYRLENQIGTAVLHPVNKGQIYEFTFPGSRLNNVDVVDADFDGVSTLAFSYLSIPFSYDGATYTKLNATGAIILSAGGGTFTINIEPETGNVTVN